MQTKSPNSRRLRPLAAAVKALLVPATALTAAPVLAQNDPLMEEIVVTATRRSATLQDVPINIAAIGEMALQEQGLKDLSEIAAWVPGIHIVDQGARASDRIVVRGLNADPLSASEALGNGGGDTVATYVGEIPVYIDLKLNDIDRVEVLLGPQGTLYGAGTLAGAIRYIPKKPQFDGVSYSLRGDAFTYSESDGFGGDVGFTFNAPLSETFALRGSIDYLDDPGFIDYDFLVREIGVSDPDPNFRDPADVAANLTRKEDANDEQALSGRFALRWTPNDAVDATMTYYFQNAESGGRTINHRTAFGTGEYVSAMRVPEPNERDNELLALEVIADLGFAELTSATGVGGYEEEGQRDQTDLLISLEYSYEAFPTFTAFTRETQDDDYFNQELRLVSTGEGPLSWIAGVFYNSFDSYADSKEFTPGYDIFAVENFGGVGPRPDSLEYFSVSEQDLTEKAIFGEISYQITDAWQVTVGARRYDYDLKTRDAVDFPLLNTVFFGAAPDAISLEFEDGGQGDSGSLFKINTSYQVNDDVLVYGTISEGYRIGNSNGVAPCPDPLPDNQIACALPDEFQYFPDQTTNYEIGMRTTLADGRVTLNGALYYIDWEDPQLAATTQNALLPITINGEGAESRGLEVNFSAILAENLALRGNYAYNEAELSETAPGLINTITPPGFQGTISYVDGLAGDRLPGSPEHQGSLFLSYGRTVGDYAMDFNYGVAGISDVLTRTAARGNGEALGGYTIHNASLSFSKANWSVTLYADNLWDKYAETGVRDTSAFAQLVSNIDGDPVVVRRYYKNVLPPRQIGLRFRWDFGS